MKKIIVLLAFPLLFISSSSFSYDYLACWDAANTHTVWARTIDNASPYTQTPYNNLVGPSAEGGTWLKGIWSNLPGESSEIFVMDYSFQSKEDAVGFCKAMRILCPTSETNGQIARQSTGTYPNNIYAAFPAAQGITQLVDCDAITPNYAIKTTATDQHNIALGLS